jgi:integrase
MWELGAAVQRDGDDDGDSSEPPFVALTDDEVSRCLWTIKDTQHRAIFTIQVELGLSTAEILGDESAGTRGIYIQDINSKEMTLKIYYKGIKKQGFKTRQVPITIECIRAVRDYLASMEMGFHDVGKLFDIGDRRWRQVLLEVQQETKIPKKISALTLRRTAIIKMLKSGMKPDEVRRRVGILREQEEYIVYAVAYVLNDPETYDKWIKQMMLDGLAGGPRHL